MTPAHPFQESKDPMIPATLARRYARALLQLAETPMQREIFGRDLAAFVRTATARTTAPASC
jgi:F0F1-type ATP synthase delta subunit